jgi:chemotaxis protein histidine kinase CheA
MSAGAGQGQSIRVGLDTLESLMTMVSELVLTRNQLIEIARRTDHADFKAPLQRLSSVTAELQEREAEQADLQQQRVELVELGEVELVIITAKQQIQQNQV